VVVGVVVVLALDDVVVDAALAIAAPPPARAPVTATVVRRGLSRIDFTSFVRLRTPSRACVGGAYERRKSL
jgi:hypothetical protein